MARRTASVYNPDDNIPGVSPQDIQDSCLENRHFGDNEINPIKIGTVESNSAVPILIVYDIPSDGSGGLNIFNANAPFKFQIHDVAIIAKSSILNGTVTIRNGTNAITDAIEMDTDTMVSRAGTINKVYSTINAGDTLSFITINATDRGLIVISAARID